MSISGLIEPTAVLWRVIDREAVPQLRPFFQTEVGGERFPAVNVEAVDNQVNGKSQPIAGEHGQDAGERRAGAPPRWRRRVSACASFDGTEYLGRALALVFA